MKNFTNVTSNEIDEAVRLCEEIADSGTCSGDYTDIIKIVSEKLNISSNVVEYYWERCYDNF